MMITGTLRMTGGQDRQQFESVPVRHADVRDHGVRRLVVDTLEEVVGAMERLGAVARLG